MSTTNSAVGTRKKIALGLSGGVDSAVSAYLLKKQGYEVTAVYLECWKMPGCRAEQDRQDALKTALHLDIPFEVLDFKDEYREKVMSYFVNEYRAGRTPNPDVLCNRVIKFGMFYDWAIEQGYDYIATGHYAQIGKGNDGRSLLLTSRDLHKDQTYFLHQLREEQLDHVLFPVGHLLKDDVRRLARKIKLPVAGKKDSVGICFVGDINVKKFLEEKLGKNPGEVVTPDKKIIGQHDGLWFYTIGQRRGYQLDTGAVKNKTDWTDKNDDIPPLYVIGKNQKKNQLVVGPEIKTKTSEWTINQPHWINPEINWENLPLQVKIRHTGQIIPCELRTVNKSLFKINTEKPVKGAAAGQFSVFYLEIEEIEDSKEKIALEIAQSKKTIKQYICLGGGVIAINI